MTTTKLINDSVEDVKEVFNKLVINPSICVDNVGKNEAMFNAVFIKSFLNRLNADDYEHFKELRDNFIQSVSNITEDDCFVDLAHITDSQE